jgi:hypothetical protein
MLIRKQDL